MLANGRIRVTVRTADVMTTAVSHSVHLAFDRADTGVPLLAEDEPHPAWPRARRWRPGFGSTTLPRLEVSFRAAPDERVFGLGQYQHGRLMHKPGVLELEQQNMRVSVPFLLSSRGYGFLWNNPAIGRVELLDDHTRWVAEATPQLDYWITAGDTPAEIIAAHADATGHPSPMPDWGLGFWQSTLRYRDRQEVLDVVREHVVARGLPLAVLVIDALHWPHHGAWAFDDRDWPDVEAMTAELADLGVRVMVSTWPLVNPATPNHDALAAIDGFARLPDGTPAGTTFVESYQDEWVRLSLIDNTRADVRALVFDRMRSGLPRPRRRGDLARRLRARDHPHRARVDHVRRGAGPRRPERVPPGPGEARGGGDVGDGPRRRRDAREVRVGRIAALRRRPVERRRPLDVGRPAAPGPGRAQRLARGDPVVDHGHRRVPRRPPRGRGVPRAVRPLVPVRDVLPGHAPPRVP